MEHDPGAHSRTAGVEMLHKIIVGEGTLQQVATGTSDEDNHGPWLVISKRKSGSKSQKRGSVHVSSSSYNKERTKSLSEAWPRPDTKNRDTRVRLGQKREGKRKAESIPTRKAFSGLVNLGQSFKPYSEGSSPKPSSGGLVKGKKVIVCSRVSLNLNSNVPKEPQVQPLPSNQKPHRVVFSWNHATQLNHEPQF